MYSFQFCFNKILSKNHIPLTNGHGDSDSLAYDGKEQNLLKWRGQLIIGWPTNELGINFRPEIVFGEKVESTFPWRFYTP